ncbi:MAG: DEAD/DEAH box helicase [Candidatus Hydrothermarchaeaceae archaeon]
MRPDIEKCLDELGFKKPTDIQRLAIPRILKGQNALLIAPTGIGKTEAAVLPIFERFLEARTKGISILYITPLKALNRDLLDRLLWWSERLGIEIAVRHGDTSPYIRRKQALSPPDMLITTPETLQAILPGSVMKRHLKNVRYVIVDEIHELAQDKRGAQLSVGLERLRELAGHRFQKVGISATVGSPDVISRYLSCREPIEILKVSMAKAIDLAVERPKPKKQDREISEKVVSSMDASTRLRRILELVDSHRSTLIFVNTRQMAEILAARFRVLKKNVGIHHGSLSQEVRISTEDDFKKGKLNALICTSSLELGIDIGSVDLVIQYNSPREVTRLLQRIGRSGHKIGKRSKGIIISTDFDDILESLVITRRALGEELEEVKVPDKPFDVLAHQIVGLALDFGTVEKKRAFKIIKRSFIFSKLTLEEFEEVLSLLGTLRLLWINNGSFKKKRTSWKYYYENLSTIPDERKYSVRDIVSQGRLGILDEAFVVNHVEPEGLIIFKGAPWRVVSLDEEKIEVEPVDDITGEIPSWVGEEIPVPLEVAREVGRIRGDIGLIDGYKAGEYTKRLARSMIKRHKKKGLPIPDDKHFLVELFENYAVMHSPFGMKVNQTLGSTFSLLLTARLGSSVTLKTDAYRIVLQSPRKLSPEDIGETINVDGDFIETFLFLTMKRTPIFRWKFVHVARRFGAISRDVSYANIAMNRIIETYEGSPIYREVLKELFRDNLDIANSKRVLEDIKSGNIRLKIIECKKPSPIAELGLAGHSEIVMPRRSVGQIIKALKKRIFRRRLEFFCTYCAGWSTSYLVKNVPDDLKCAKCGAKSLAVIKGRGRELKSLYRRFKKGNVTDEEKKEIKRMQLSANLYLSYGKKAVIAQAGRGIGPQVAKRVLPALSEDGFYKRILKAERNYARTKRFWD